MQQWLDGILTGSSWWLLIEPVNQQGSGEGIDLR